MYKSLNAAASGVKEIYQTSQEKGKKKEIMGGRGKERAEWWVLVTDTGRGCKGSPQSNTQGAKRAQPFG